MSQATDELKEEIARGLDAMRTLRDEVRLKLHLAGMDAKDEWNKLEPHLMELEHAAGQFTDATRAKMSDAIKRLSKLRSSLS
jgi:hypothetical protein